ncbi:hypothetical protein L1887_44292 [Cichorium endivia]|nr:hypothetical protein L1887_44292 [Cichorium endivia]
MVLLPCRSIPLSQQGDLDSLLLLLPCRSVPLSPSLFSFLLFRGGGTRGVKGGGTHLLSQPEILYPSTAVILILDYQTEPFAANALGCGVGAAMIGISDDPATSLKFCTTSLTATKIAFVCLAGVKVEIVFGKFELVCLAGVKVEIVFGKFELETSRKLIVDSLLYTHKFERQINENLVPYTTGPLCSVNLIRLWFVLPVRGANDNRFTILYSRIHNTAGPPLLRPSVSEASTQLKVDGSNRAENLTKKVRSLEAKCAYLEQKSAIKKIYATPLLISYIAP